MIDECSMVDAELGRDLMSFGVPLLVLGDPAQLPPIQGGGFFTEAEPDAMLTEVHRQAQDDPIVRLSMQVRAGERLEPGRYGETQVVRAQRPRSRSACIEADQILVGRNATRRAYNTRHARAARSRGRLAGRRRQAGLPAQQPQARACSTAASGRVEGTRSRKIRRHLTLRIVPDADLSGAAMAVKGVKVSVRRECFTRRHRELSTGRSASNTTNSTTAMC